MKKYALLFTYTTFDNYGQTLQNLASIKILEKYGFETHTAVTDISDIIASSSNTSLLSQIRKAFKILRKSPKNFGKKIIILLAMKGINASYKGKRERFKEFCKKYINPISFATNEDNIRILAKYDVLIAGSDQIWNPEFFTDSKKRPRLRLDRIPYYLPFDIAKKRISLSTSFAIESKNFFTYPPTIINSYRDRLKAFDAISVRENEGALIINKLLGRNATVLLDPTAYLTREEWLGVAKKPIWLDKRMRSSKGFVLLYMLDPNSKVEGRARNYAKANGLAMFSITNIMDQELYATAPDQFLYLFANAEVVYTDSFHGTIFSIIFHTPFLHARNQIGRASRFTRIHDLLEKFNMQNRLIEKVAPGDEKRVDFTNVKTILAQERKRTDEYITAALESEKTLSDMLAESFC